MLMLNLLIPRLSYLKLLLEVLITLHILYIDWLLILPNLKNSQRKSPVVKNEMKSTFV